jgi:PilZ domain
MEQISAEVRHVQNTRRWPRHQVDLPVRIIALNGIITTPVTARGGEISRAGMALHAPLALNPGDLMQLQFPTPTPSPRVRAVVRNRTGQCLGLEFLTQLPPDNEARDPSRFLPSSVLDGSRESGESVHSCNPQTLYAGLRRKQEELRQVQREIDALNMAILLLADDEKEFSRAISLIDVIPHASLR